MTDQEKIESLLDLFVTPGWQLVIEDFKEVHASIESIRNVNDERALYRAKGKLDVLDILLAYEQSVKLAAEEDNAPTV